MSLLDKKTILITGGTGSFGKKFIEIVLKKYKPKKIIIFSRDELKQYLMKSQLKKYGKILRYFLGDVRDLDRLRLAMQDVDLVIHAAALKHVESGEYNPFEVIKTNVVGTQNVVDAIVDSKVENAIFLSTDKAVSPINLYGASKLAAEKLFIAANNFSKKKFSVVKYGNVFNSRGSVVPTFIEQIKKRNKLFLTNKKMTRFNISLEEGVNFVIMCLNKMIGGETFIPIMDTIEIIELIKILNPKQGFEEIGIKPGEKIHEELISASDNSVKINCGKYFIICPSTSLSRDSIVKKYLKKNRGKIIKNNFSYNSSDTKKRLKSSEIKKLVIKNYQIK